MWLAAFYLWGTLLTFSVCDICPENAASWVTLNPLGDCVDEEDLCPYRLTLPPLSIQLPRPFRELEEMAKELQNLKEVVNQLRRDCQECKGKHSIERGGWMDHRDDVERRPQHPRHNISIKEEEKVTRIFTSTLPQGDTSETIKESEKRPNHSILGGREWNINPRIDSTQGTTDLTSEMSRVVKIFNPLLDEVPEDISERELKRSEVTEPSLAIKKDDVQTATNGKLQPNVLRDGHAKNISDILTARRRVQNVDDPNGLRDPSTKTKDLSTSVGNRRVVNFPGGGRPLRPRGSYINSRVVSVNNGGRLKSPAFVRKTNPQVEETMDKTEPEEDGFSPARSGIMRVKETSPRIANTKSGGIGGSSLSTDDQNKQGIRRVSGPKTDDEHARVSEDNLRNINKPKITGLPTKLRKEKQGDVSHTDANKTGSSIITSTEQPNMVKEEKEHMGLSESLVDISSSTVNREDLSVPGRQVEIEKYLNPITETNNGQIDSTILDEADSPFNAGTVNPPDLTDEMQLETFIVGAVEETGLNLLNTDTVDIQSKRKASFSEDLVEPTIVPTVKSKSETINGQIGSIILDKADSTFNAGTVNPPDLEMQLETFIVGAVEETGLNLLNTDTVDIQSKRKALFSEDLVEPSIVPTVKTKPINTNVRMTSRFKLPVGGHGTRITSKTPLKAVAEQPQNRKKNISMIHEVRQEARYVIPNTTVISPAGPKLRTNITGKLSVNRSIGVPLKQSIPFRKNVSGIIKPNYTRKKPNFQTELNTNRGIKIKVSTTNQFFGPTGAAPTVERETIKHIPQAIRPNVLDNDRLKNNITESVLKNVPVGDVRDLDKVREGIKRPGDISSSSQDPNTMQSGTSNLPAGENEGTNIYGQNPSEGRKKRPIVSTLKREFSKEPGASQFPASEHENVDIVTNTNVEMSKNLSRDTHRTSENVGPAPNVESKVLHNPWLKNNNTKSKTPSKPQNTANVQDLETIQQGKTQVGDNGETNTDDPNIRQSESSNSPNGGKESKLFSLGTADEVDNRRKGPKAPTLKMELSKEPGIKQLATVSVSENVGPTPNVKSNILHNPWLKNNNTKSKTPSKPQNAANVQDLETVQQGKTQVGDNGETNTEDPNIRQSESSNSPNGGKESKTFSLGTADEVDNRRKGPKALTLNMELSKEPGIIQLATVSLTDTENNATVTNAHVETPKSGGGDTPISFENIGATKELEKNPGEVLSNHNSVDTAQSYSGEGYAVPVVSEGLPNVEEIKGSKLFSLSPEDTAEGFKSHAVSDEVTEKEKAETKIHSTCLGDCNTTSTQHSQTSTSQTRTALAFGREKGPAQDCADYMTKSRRNGVYRVTPRPRNTTFPVFCDMVSSGGGWTVIQHRFDGSTSFNRTWDEYKNGFGKLLGEFWLGNDKIHLLTKAKNMSLRIEIEDFEGVREYAQYDHFYVANESQHYRLSIDGYSGTAGNALQFSKKYNHDQKFFTTPDKDNDQYPSGNCGAYYSSGWWFDACMSANLNGKYYHSKYKGVRNGIFWGTWHNITMEYYPTNERQSFRTVRMMIRPKK